MEKKDIKDYLHFYLLSGIRVYVFPDDTITNGFLDRYKNDNPCGVYNPLLTFGTYHQFLKDGYKPILRPLSSMTEDECRVITGYDKFAHQREIRKFWKDEKCACLEYRWPHKDMVDGYAYSSNAVYFSKKEWEPALFKYLLSKGFDLFNLIPEGLAIDSTLKPV